MPYISFFLFNQRPCSFDHQTSRIENCFITCRSELVTKENPVPMCRPLAGSKKKALRQGICLEKQKKKKIIVAEVLKDPKTKLCCGDDQRELAKEVKVMASAEAN